MDANVSKTTANPKAYFGVALGKGGNPNLTFFRKQPKVRGKAAVKAAKRARMLRLNAGPLAIAA